MIDPLTGTDVTGYVDPSSNGTGGGGFSFSNFLDQVGTGIAGWGTQALQQAVNNSTQQKTSTAPASSALAGSTGTGLSTNAMLLIGGGLLAVVLLVITMGRK